MAAAFFERSWQDGNRKNRLRESLRRAGRVFAILIGLYGLLSMQFMLVFIAFFVYLGATQESAVVIGRTLTEGVPVRKAMITEFRTLEHGTTVREAANMLLATSQQDFPIVLGEQVMGLLGRNALLRGMAVDGPDAYVAGIMDRNFPRVSPDVSLTQAIPLLAQTTCVLVMEQEKLLGLLTRENLSEYLMLRRFGMAARHYCLIPAGGPRKKFRIANESCASCDSCNPLTDTGQDLRAS